MRNTCRFVISMTKTETEINGAKAQPDLIFRFQEESYIKENTPGEDMVAIYF